MKRCSTCNVALSEVQIGSLAKHIRGTCLDVYPNLPGRLTVEDILAKPYVQVGHLTGKQLLWRGLLWIGVPLALLAFAIWGHW